MEFGFGHVEFEVSVACVSEAECGLSHQNPSGDLGVVHEDAEEGPQEADLGHIVFR